MDQHGSSRWRRDRRSGIFDQALVGVNDAHHR